MMSVAPAGAGGFARSFGQWPDGHAPAFAGGAKPETFPAVPAIRAELSEAATGRTDSGRGMNNQ